ncbi:DUF2683 family protein [Candidatus Methanoperedens nitratireducens]|uniref:Antitoxin n=1 Tax=Candidatus Methanoperedens nitratireducens TaxID=1392998 RepID=A0A284VNP1_9EURY|nr:DUF2683 family protein [Candidatus Methanoperedens nitroreducens]SNQ60807.1 conserved hypothetical protein [Candidatus Methanoperedens nitroreducens]
MVKAIININDRTNRVLNIVKAKHGLKNKSEAINKVVNEYGRSLLEPELRPEFIEKIKARQKERTVKVTDFRSHYGLK